MDLETGLLSVGAVVFSAIVIFVISMFGIKETSYEEAIAEQRRVPDELLFGKKEKVKEKKYKNKAGKKSKEKKEEKEEVKEEKAEHVQFEQVAQILSPETTETVKGNKKKGKADKVKPILLNKDEPVVVASEAELQPSQTDTNHFDVIQPKDEFELITSQIRENAGVGMSQTEVIVKQSPKHTPTKSKKMKQQESMKKEEENKDSDGNVANHHYQQHQTEVTAKEVSKKSKKKNNFLAQIGGDADGINMSLLSPLVQKAELSRSEIQILIDQLLNKQLDNPTEYSEWTEGRADPVIKLKKQLAEKEKALAEQNEASAAFSKRLTDLRAEYNSERSRLTASVRQLEEALNGRALEVQTLHTRVQHILESHAAEKQGFSRQIEQLQAKVNEDAAIIHKMQEDQGQTQGHMQQELLAQRKQLEVQFAQMRETENSLKVQLAQKHAEVQELQNVNMTITQDLQATCESTSAEIEAHRQEIAILQEQLMHSEGQLAHYEESAERMQDVIRQLEESRRAQNEMDHRLKTVHRHEQELQKQISSLQSELSAAKAQVAEMEHVKAELSKIQTDMSSSQSESQIKTAELMNVKSTLHEKEDELNKMSAQLQKSHAEISKLTQEKKKAQEDCTQAQNHAAQIKDQLKNVQQELSNTRQELEKLSHANVSQKLIDSEGVARSNSVDARENGIEGGKSQNLNAQILEYTKTISKKEDELKVLRTDLTHKELEINRLNSQMENLTSDVNSKNSAAQRLRDDLEAEREKHLDEIEKIKVEQENATKALLRRIFPDVDVQEQLYDEWVNSFVEKARAVIVSVKQDKNTEELEEQNKNLQSLVSHYKRIIEETEGMLNKLQNHIESEEERWQTQLWQKEQEISTLRTEIVNIQEKPATIEDVCIKK